MRCQRWEQFCNTKLGKLYLTIPFEEMANRFPSKKNNTGRKPTFSIEGCIGLMFLKHYSGCSDEKLIEDINGNWMKQLFCGIRLKEGQMIKDSSMVSRKRGFIGHHLKVDEIQRILVAEWSEHIEQQQSNVSDATCYESYVRYPTDVKLLWESIKWVHKQICSLSNFGNYRIPSSKYREQKKKYMAYSRLRRKTYKKTRRVIKRALYLLNKLLGQITPLIGLWQLSNRLGDKSPVKADFFERLHTIKQVYKQQQLHFERPDVSIKNRIVSLAKPYLRPIVRGKETRRVEFGKKVHKMMVGGIGFIEHWDFNAFHEGNRTIKTIGKHRKYFGTCQHFGGDQIYATNKNRKYCTENGIFTGFRKKGRPGKQEDQARQLRSLIAKERATVLEGSFGNDKNHYGLAKVKARKEHTENAWIFFGIMTANAMKIAKRMNSPP